MSLKIKTFKLFFVFDDSDWVALSDVLQERFPQAIYFSRDLKRPLLAAYKEESRHWPIQYWRSLDQFQRDAQGDVYSIRDPWPPDIDSGQDLNLIGGWENSYMDPTEEGFHRHGRCAEFTRYRSNVESQTIATRIDQFDELAIERIGTLPAGKYGNARFVFHERFSTLKVAFNDCELPLKEFAGEIRRIVQKLGTRSVALYDPLTSEILDPSYDTERSLIGWNLLRKIHDGEVGYLMMPAVYDDVSDFHPRRDGVAGLIGPRPSHPRVRAWSAKK